MKINGVFIFIVLALLSLPAFAQFTQNFSGDTKRYVIRLNVDELGILSERSTAENIQQKRSIGNDLVGMLVSRVDSAFKKRSESLARATDATINNPNKFVKSLLWKPDVFIMDLTKEEAIYLAVQPEVKAVEHSQTVYSNELNTQTILCCSDNLGLDRIDQKGSAANA